MCTQYRCIEISIILPDNNYNNKKLNFMREHLNFIKISGTNLMNVAGLLKENA